MISDARALLSTYQHARPSSRSPSWFSTEAIEYHKLPKLPLPTSYHRTSRLKIERPSRGGSLNERTGTGNLCEAVEDSAQSEWFSFTALWSSWCISRYTHTH